MFINSTRFFFKKYTIVIFGWLPSDLKGGYFVYIEFGKTYDLMVKYIQGYNT